jgi:hypothetical protein
MPKPTPQAKFVTFRIPDEMYANLEAIKARDGIPYSEQIRRALTLWLVASKQGSAPRPKAGSR